MSRKLKIPIKKHSKRYRQSKWELSEPWWGCPEPLDTLYLVTDLQRVPKTHTTLASLGISKPIIYPVPEGYDVVPLSYGGFTFKKKLGIFKNLWQNKIRRKI